LGRGYFDGPCCCAPALANPRRATGRFRHRL